MKRIIAVFLVLVLICTSAVVLLKREKNTCDNFVYNYLDHGEFINLTINLDDYLALGRGFDEMFIYNKKTRDMFQLGEDVFDYKKQYSVPVFGVGNTLYYTAKDPKMNTNAVYSFNIDTYEKKRVYAKSALIDVDGFLGLNELFGITNGYSMGAFSQINKYILFDEKLMPAIDATTLLDEKDKNDEFMADVIEEKLSANQSGILMMNERNNLVFYDFESDTFSVLSGEKIKDFFITESDIYFIPFNKPGQLYKSDFKLKNKTYIGECDFKDVRVQKDKPVYISDGKRVFKLQDDKLIFILDIDDDNIKWEADENVIWLYNAETLKVESVDYSK